MKKFIFYIFLMFLTVCLPSLSYAKTLGPYKGTVIDSQTGEPIEGASVFFYWTKMIPQLIHGRSELIEAHIANTDKEGRYHILKISANLGLSAMLESTNVIIYQPGYQAYIVRINYLYAYEKPDLFIKEKEPIVKLDRIPHNFDYEMHYKEIVDALQGIDDYPYSSPLPTDELYWDKIVEMSLRGIPEKEEFLRHVEWEGRRDMSEDIE